MRNITHYLVVTESKQAVFEAAMLTFIQLGWQPYGNVQHIKRPFDDGSGYQEQYMQAIVRYDGGEQ